MERERAEQEKKEAALAASMQDSKKKLLNDLAEDVAKRDAAVKNLQEMKDKEKEGLIESLAGGELELPFTYVNTYYLLVGKWK